MIRGLQRFFDALHDAGIRTSPAERLDALRAVDRVGLEHAVRFRHALLATLVKRAGQRAAFDEVFARHFRAPGLAGHGEGPGRRPARGDGRSERPSPAAEPDAAASPRAPSRDAEPERAGRPRAEREADRMARALRELAEGRRERWGRLRHVHAAPAAGPTEGPRGTRTRRSAPVREARPRGPLRDAAGSRERTELAREVRREIERLRLRTGRRLRATVSGRPYLRRVFRESLRTGGVPFRLPHRRRRTRTPRVVLLVDVSWSTARAAGLFLEMACEFLRLGRQTRVHLFVDRPVDATEAVSRWAGRRRREGFSALLGSIPGLNLDAPSDYGRVFHALLTAPGRPRGRSTVLVVLGDGRTNVFDPLDWALAELAEGCGAALWLVPEPRSRWGTGDSALPRYLPRVDAAVEAGDVAGLARGVAELLRRL